MSEFRFLHCSDLHLDAPLSGLAESHPKLQSVLRDATFRAYDNIIDLAIAEKIHAMVIAGDIYNSADKSLRAQLKFRDGLARLSEHGIPSYVAHGNHDPLNSWSASLEWPEKVTIFPGEQVESKPVIANGETLATIYGISYPKRNVTENLARRFKHKPGQGFSIGVLHTNVGAQPAHDNYAPCQLNDLIASGIDYWALGHIHAQKILRESSPIVAYCGNSQARGFWEQGEKGCFLVTLKNNLPPKLQFVSTDVARFHSLEIDISDCETLDQLIKILVVRCRKKGEDAGDRDIILLVRLTGRPVLHKELNRPGTLEALTEDLQNKLSDQSPRIWANLKIDTRGRFDVDSLRLGNDFIADMLSLYEEASSDQLDYFREILNPLYQEWQGKSFLIPPSDTELRELIKQARDITLDQIAEET